VLHKRGKVTALSVQHTHGGTEGSDPPLLKNKCVKKTHLKIVWLKVIKIRKGDTVESTSKLKRC